MRVLSFSPHWEITKPFTATCIVRSYIPTLVWARVYDVFARRTAVGKQKLSGAWAAAGNWNRRTGSAKN